MDGGPACVVASGGGARPSSDEDSDSEDDALQICRRDTDAVQRDISVVRWGTDVVQRVADEDEDVVRGGSSSSLFSRIMSGQGLLDAVSAAEHRSADPEPVPCGGDARTAPECPAPPRPEPRASKLRPLARSRGVPLSCQLVSNLNRAPVGPQRAAVCDERLREAQWALEDAMGFLRRLQALAEHGAWAEELEEELGEAWFLCTGMAFALEVLAANSHACGDCGSRTALAFEQLQLDVVGCHIAFSEAAQRWKEAKASELSFSGILGLVGSWIRCTSTRQQDDLALCPKL